MLKLRLKLRNQPRSQPRNLSHWPFLQLKCQRLNQPLKLRQNQAPLLVQQRRQRLNHLQLQAVFLHAQAAKELLWLHLSDQKMSVLDFKNWVCTRKARQNQSLFSQGKHKLWIFSKLFFSENQQTKGVAELVDVNDVFASDTYNSQENDFEKHDKNAYKLDVHYR